MIRRPGYIEKIHRFLGAPVIKILTGMRRVGKSTILTQLAGSLRERAVPEANIVLVNMELFSNASLRDPARLHQHIHAALAGTTGPSYILIDEVQEVLEWERVVQSLLAENLGDIVLTGSNAHMLSSELATLLTGRYIEIPVASLSLSEFIEIRSESVAAPEPRLGINNPAASYGECDPKKFNEYLQFGGLPGLHHLPLQEEYAVPYLNAVLDTLLLRDIVQRHRIRDVSVLEKILLFCMDCTGSLVSIKSIADYFKSQGMRVGLETVAQYLSHLCEASILVRVPRFDIQGRRQMEYLDKYYLTDVGLRYGRLGWSTKRLPGTLETLVFHELVRRGWKVSVGALAKREIDFVAQRHDEKLYVQVATYLTEESTLEREFGNLEAIPDNFPKLVLSLDDLPVGGRNGVRWQNVRDWLM
ncbi:MAG TPA: ATP-binding protein [Fibrobacteria bacterium]|nr:ATP-binding protein [Fibrobacteria bacterium]